jgi:hypothetical protein
LFIKFGGAESGSVVRFGYKSGFFHEIHYFSLSFLYSLFLSVSFLSFLPSFFLFVFFYASHLGQFVNIQFLFLENAWGRGEVFTWFWFEGLKARDHWEDLGVGGRITLKWTLGR